MGDFFQTPRQVAVAETQFGPVPHAKIGKHCSFPLEGLELNVGREGQPAQREVAGKLIDLPLSAPSRRRIVLHAEFHMTLIGTGQASLRVSCEGQRTARHARFQEQAARPDGSLASVTRSGQVRLVLPRSVQPRRHVLVWLQVEAESLAAGGNVLAAWNSMNCSVL